MKLHLTRPLSLIVALLWAMNVQAQPVPPSTANAAGEQFRYAERKLSLTEVYALKWDALVASLKEQAQGLISDRAGSVVDKPDKCFYYWHGGDEFLVRVSLPPEAKPVAAEIADELVKWLTDQITEADQTSRKQAIEMRKVRVALREGPAQEQEARLRHLREQLREQSGRSDISPASLTAALSSAEEQRQKMELDLLSKTARREAIEKEIAAAGERIEKKVASDPIAAELQKVVEARQSQIERIKQMAASGQASQSELDEAVGRAAEARAKLLEHQRDAAAAAGGNALEALGLELVTLSIDSRELEAKLAYLKEKLPGLREAVEQLDQLRQLEDDAASARAELHRATRELREIQDKLELAPPLKIQLKESKNAPSAQASEGF